jgi:flagellar basal body-associated protein FliL
MNEQTFYQKNKKVINIGLIVLLVVGVILAIVLPLTLGGHGGDDPYNPNPPEPEPTEPDPF